MKSPIFHQSPPAPAPAEHPRASGGSQAAQPPAGLVTLKTSDTLLPHTVEIDPDKARHTRLKRSLLVAAKLFEHSFRGFRVKPAMLTLTYREVDGFEPRHISELLKRIRQWLQRRGVRFC